MTTPSVQRAFEATMVRLKSSSTGQQLRRGWSSGSTAAVRVGVVRGRRVFSSKVTAAPVPAAAVEVAGGAGREDSIEAVASSPVGAADMPSRKPMDGYLNKVCMFFEPRKARVRCTRLSLAGSLALASHPPLLLWSDDSLTCLHSTKYG